MWRNNLKYLKYQINPHFFMNTLNNIHTLIDIDPDKAKEALIEPVENDALCALRGQQRHGAA